MGLIDLSDEKGAEKTVLMEAPIELFEKDYETGLDLSLIHILDKAKIAYELIPYEVDENDLSTIHVAASLGENIEQVFKKMCIRDSSDIFQVSYGYGLFTGGLGAHAGAENIGASVIPMSSGNTEKQITLMHRCV